MFRPFCIVAGLSLLVQCWPPIAAGADAAEVVAVRKIWDAGRHNAFTDLIRWRDQWWCGFREAEGHIGPTDGKIRLICSIDGEKWGSAALIAEDGIDLRDPKLSITPDNRLMIVAGGSNYANPARKLTGRQPRVTFSTDGINWTEPRTVLAPGEWLWRVTWHDGVAYGTAYDVPVNAAASRPGLELHLYKSKNGADWERVTAMEVPDQPNETTLRFDPDGTMRAIVRRESGDQVGWLGVAKPPYDKWTWRPTNLRLGGPNLLRLPDGRWLSAARHYTDKQQRTVLALLSIDDAKFTPIATLPSAGDNSYAGLVWHDGLLWVSYYSSHEGRTSIYLAKLKMPPQG